MQVGGRVHPVESGAVRPRRTIPAWFGRAAILAALLSLSGLAAVLTRGADVNYDLEYELSWGRALANGELPDFELAGSPTPHPLTTLMTTVADLLPAVDAVAVMHGLAFISYGALVLCTALIAVELFGWTAGAIAGVVIGVSTPVLVNTAIAFQDAMTAALVMLAVLLEVRRPRQGVGPLVALAAAGLLRPEPWGLAAAYWLWLLPGRTWRDRIQLAALAVAGPALWLVADLVVTGNPLFSFTHTREGAAVAARTTGLDDAPFQLYDHLRFAIDRAGVAGGVLGAGGAAFLLWRPDLARRAREVDSRAVVPLATLVLLCAAFIALGASSLSLLARYVLAPAALLAIFCGFALTAWRHLASRALVAVALLAATGLAVDGVRGVVFQADRLSPLMTNFRLERDILQDLGSLAGGMDPLIERCGSPTVSSYRTRPYLAYDLGIQPREVGLEESPPAAPARMLYVAPASKQARDVFTLLNRDGGSLPPPPRGFRRAAGNSSWAAYARDC